jgi:hypothetical protein
MAINQLANGDRLESELALDRERLCDIREITALCNQLRILDLANGRLRPQYTILHTQGYRVFGVDLANNPNCDVFDLGYRLARRLYAIRLHGPGDKFESDMLTCSDDSRCYMRERHSIW